MVRRCWTRRERRLRRYNGLDRWKYDLSLRWETGHSTDPFSISVQVKFHQFWYRPLNNLLIPRSMPQSYDEALCSQEVGLVAMIWIPEWRRGRGLAKDILTWIQTELNTKYDMPMAIGPLVDGRGAIQRIAQSIGIYKATMPMTWVQQYHSSRHDRVLIYADRIPGIPRLAVGSQDAADLLECPQWTHILTLRGPRFSRRTTHPGIVYRRIRIEDDEDANIAQYFETYANWIHTILSSHPKNQCLVHCHAGINRSPTIIVYYLVRYHGHTVDTALHLIRQVRSGVLTGNDGFLQQLRHHPPKTLFSF